MTVLDDVGPGSLKLVIAADHPAAEAALRDHVASQNLCSAGSGAWVVFCEDEPADIRDWLAGAVPGVHALVVEFERWSAYGDTLDPAWLLRRGH